MKDLRKKAMGVGLVRTTLLVIILIIMLFTVLADTAEDIGNAAGNITAQSDVYPLTSFFKKKGVLLLALIAGIVITIITAVLPKGK